MSTPTPSDPAPPAPPRSSYSMGSLPNLARSLIVILGIVLALVLIVPRVTQVQRPAVDAAAVAKDAATTSHLALVVPVGLPDGWTCTTATWAPSTENVMTYQGTWTTPGGTYLSLKQAVSPSPKWLTTVTASGQSTGQVTLGGRTWDKRVGTAATGGDQTSYVATDASSGLTTVVTGTANDADVATFMGDLRPAV